MFSRVRSAEPHITLYAGVCVCVWMCVFMCVQDGGYSRRWSDPGYQQRQFKREAPERGDPPAADGRRDRHPQDKKTARQ